MDKFQKRVMESLKDIGATQHRRSGHIIFKLPNGNNFVISTTPSDWRSWRQAASNLKRALNTSQPEVAATVVIQEPPIRKRRTRIPNRNATDKSEDLVLRLGSPAGGNIASPSETGSLRFDSIAELLIVAQSVDSFWTLDGYGKIRVIQKLTSHFSRSIVVTTMFSLAELTSSQPPTPQNLQNVSNLLWKNIWLQHCRDWQSRGVPALFIRDPELGDVVVELAACNRLSGRNDIAVIPARFDPEGTFFAHWPLWSSDPTSEDTWSTETPNRSIAYSFVNRKGMQKWGIRQASTTSWTDLRSVRGPTANFIEILARYKREEAYRDS